MNNPAVKTREDVITDLNDSGFDEKQSRGVVQAVVDTTASLDLATRTDLKKETDALKATVDKIYIWVRWGFGILLAFMFFLSTRVG